MASQSKNGQNSVLRQTTVCRLEITSSYSAVENVWNWVEGLDLEEWLINEPKTNKTEGPMQLRALGQLAANQDYDPRTTVIYPAGTTMGFYLWQLGAALAHLDPQSETTLGAGDKATATFAVPSDKGDLVCPVCWLRFDKGDVMHIASHESLRGDPLLGEDVMLRFAHDRVEQPWPRTRRDGRALPRHRLPSLPAQAAAPGFLDLPHHIISLVGETTAGIRTSCPPGCAPPPWRLITWPCTSAALRSDRS